MISWREDEGQFHSWRIGASQAHPARATTQPQPSVLGNSDSRFRSFAGVGSTASSPDVGPESGGRTCHHNEKGTRIARSISMLVRLPRCGRSILHFTLPGSSFSRRSLSAWRSPVRHPWSDPFALSEVPHGGSASAYLSFIHLKRICRTRRGRCAFTNGSNHV
jgi:hypothetical protein